MKPICCLVLLSLAIVCHADDKPALERADEKLPVVKMPRGKFPPAKKLPEAPLLEKGYPANTEVAVEGEIEIPDKDFEKFRILLVKIRDNNKKHGWVTAMSRAGGKPVKIKNGLYHYRSVIKTPPMTRVLYFEVYAVTRKPNLELITRARVDIDVDLE